MKTINNILTITPNSTEMKKLSLIVFSMVLLWSCGNDTSVEALVEAGDLSELRAKKAELSAQQSELGAQIATLDAAIQKLDVNNQFALVEAMTVTDTLFKHYVEIPGDVETDENIIIYPEYSGLLERVMVAEGSRVSKGQVLARIDAGGLESQLAQLQAQAALAKTTFERQERLWKQNIGSEIQFLEAQTNYEAVQNSVKQLQSQLSKTVVRAPFSGIIDEVLTDQGEVVAPGQSRLFRLINLSNMYITAAIPENYLGKIRKGTEVKVRIGATGSSFVSEVRQAGNFINPNNRTFEVKIAIPENAGEVKPNLIATVLLNDYTAQDAIIIPESVVQKNSAGESIAYVIQSANDSTGKAQKRVLEIGRSYEDSVEVISGLEPGEILITSGAKSVREGEQVKIIK
jgi:membrane fusion protein, multidrug efflux system